MYKHCQCHSEIRRPIRLGIAVWWLHLVHSGSDSDPQTKRRRRILHLEFAPSAELPDGYAWHDFRAALALKARVS